MSNINPRLKDYKLSHKGLKRAFAFGKQTDLSWLSKTLILGALPTLGAVNYLEAQCLGDTTANFPVPNNSNNGFVIDVDGDGTDDFKIFDNGNSPYFATLHMQALNGGQVLTQGGSGTVKNYANGATINGTANVNQYGGFWWLVFLNPANTQMIGPWAPPYPTSGFIGIRQGGFNGFIQLTVNSGAIIGNTSAQYNITITDSGLATASGTVIAGDCSSITLPVELTNFEAKPNKDKIDLNWATASEVNNAGFEIERSLDGNNFSRLGFIEGAGTSDFAQEYQFTDDTAIKGKQYYYRLKQVDFNGKFEYSEIRSVSLEAENWLGEVYPNPALEGTVNIDFNTDNEKKWKISVFNTTGQQISSDIRVIEKGNSVQTFDLNGFSEGVYFIKIEHSEKQFYKKVVVGKNL